LLSLFLAYLKSIFYDPLGHFFSTSVQNGIEGLISLNFIYGQISKMVFLFGNLEATKLEELQYF